jgi:recombination protein RecA
MIRRRQSNSPPKLSDQVKRHAATVIKQQAEYDGTDTFISTGSTLLDLAISGGRHRGGGIPGGILMEIFGPAGCGKTVLLCELAGAVQRQGGECRFLDPEARLNKNFARIFDLNIEDMTYEMPDTVTKVFTPVRKWDPPAGKIHGVFADSLAALTTDMELEDKDQMGMRRAKEFSQELRKTCRTITDHNLLFVCSNQVRENLDAGPYEQKFKSTGGNAIGFYSSLRLRCMNPQKIKVKRNIAGKEVTRVIGVETMVEVFKSSVWKPYHSAIVPIIFDYGIDNVRQSLTYVKQTTGNKTYTVQGETVGRSIEEAITAVETDNLERKLRRDVIDLWEDVEAKFKQDRKPKRRP